MTGLHSEIHHCRTPQHKEYDNANGPVMITNILMLGAGGFFWVIFVVIVFMISIEAGSALFAIIFNPLAWGSAVCAIVRIAQETTSLGQFSGIFLMGSVIAMVGGGAAVSWIANEVTS